MPLLSVLRDMLELSENKFETQQILNEKNVFINGKLAKSLDNRLGIFDRLYVKKVEKYFTLHLTENGKLKIVEINEKIAATKPCKIIGKKVVNKNKIQVNCYDGRNFLSNEKVNTGDVFIVDLKSGKILKTIKMEKNAFAYIISGKNIGKFGKIKEIIENKITIETKDKKITTPKENIFILEENETAK
jgi:ribosomal protein S4E